MTRRSEQLLFRWAPGLVGAAFYLLFAMLWLHAPQAYSRLVLITSAAPLEARPFGDLGAVLQAAVCWREGVNVYAPSACMHGGVYNYAPFLLRMAYLPLGPREQMPGGLMLGLLFLAALAWLPAPRSRDELLFRICATCSQTVILALERANLDVVIFLMVMLSVMLLLANRWAALAGYAVLLLAAAMKFYPAALLALVLRERRRQLFIVAVAALVCGLAYMLAFFKGTATAISIIPGGMHFGGIFGAMDLPFGLVFLHFLPVFTLHPNLALYMGVMRRPDVLPLRTLGIVILTCAALVVAGRTTSRYRQAFNGLGQKHGLLLLAGAMTMTFCFFAAQNITYRGIFMLLTLPGLWAMADQPGQAARQRLFLLISAVFFLLWMDFWGDLVGVSAILLLKQSQQAYPEFGYWLLAQCVWWWVIIQFLAIIFCFLRETVAKLVSPAHG